MLSPVDHRVSVLLAIGSFVFIAVTKCLSMWFRKVAFMKRIIRRCAAAVAAAVTMTEFINMAAPS